MVKLTEREMEIIQECTGLRPLSDQAARNSGLADHFGDDTFYVDQEGIYVFEETKLVPEATHPVTALMIAAVLSVDEESGGVTVHEVEPQPTTLTVDLA